MLQKTILLLVKGVSRRVCSERVPKVFRWCPEHCFVPAMSNMFRNSGTCSEHVPNFRNTSEQIPEQSVPKICPFGTLFRTCSELPEHLGTNSGTKCSQNLPFRNTVPNVFRTDLFGTLRNTTCSEDCFPGECSRPS